MKALPAHLLFQSSFCCCGNHHAQSNLGRGGLNSPSTSRLLLIPEGSNHRTCIRDCEGMLLTGLLSYTDLHACLFLYRSMCLGMVLPTVVWALSYPSVKTTSHRHDRRPFFSVHFLGRSSPSRVTLGCVKLTRAPAFLFVLICTSPFCLENRKPGLPTSSNLH